MILRYVALNTFCRYSWVRQIFARTSETLDFKNFWGNMPMEHLPSKIEFLWPPIQIN